jgi:hypothetical protein
LRRVMRSEGENERRGKEGEKEERRRDNDK